MTDLRKGDSEPQPRFRKSRFFHSLDQWYFITREGTVEGPYRDKTHAEDMLKVYLNDLDDAVH